MSMKAVKIIDIICIVIFVLMGVYIFALPEATQDLLLPVFTIINPYKTGAWIMGIGFLVTCLWGKGKAGLAFSCCNRMYCGNLQEEKKIRKKRQTRAPHYQSRRWGALIMPRYRL